ncbi:MAG: class I SAM-dependent methyltransferase [Proteobacteria bacterium]|nr:class I SAM-dependent methyltransferase [Pseudomonadota bacterium]
MEPTQHWERVYQTKAASEVSWYRPHLDVSLGLITSAVPDRAARVVDVGGGEATLVDDLVAAGYAHVDVLDLSATALQVARERLGESGASVGWLHGDVTTFPGAHDAGRRAAAVRVLHVPRVSRTASGVRGTRRS